MLEKVKFLTPLSLKFLKTNNLNINEMKSKFRKNGKSRIGAEYLIHQQNLSKTMIISAFCGTGKTHLCKILREQAIEIECWTYQGRKDIFPDNIIKDIKAKVGKVKYIFISSNPVVIDRLVKEGINIYIYYPEQGLKDEYINRYKNRGSSDDFVDMLDRNWDDWLKEIHERYPNGTVIKSEEYLSEYILMKNKLTPTILKDEADYKKF